MRKKSIDIVIGANYGDEGKGQYTYTLAKKYAEEDKGSSTVVFLNNGGSQRGHTVTTTKDTTHIFHHFGSGTFAGAATYCTKNFILNPIMFAEEYNEIKQLLPREGIEDMPSLFIESDCLLTTPYDMIFNQIKSKLKNRKDTCGFGIYETMLGGLTLHRYLKEKDVVDLMKTIKQNKLEEAYIEFSKEEVDEAFKEYMIDVDETMLLERYEKDVSFMLEHVKLVDVDHYLIDDPYDHYIIENGQGLELDFFRDRHFGTPSLTGLNGCMNILVDISKSVGGVANVDIKPHFITRWYITRHGDGHINGMYPFKDEKEYIQSILNQYDTTNVTNPNQGSIRFKILSPEKIVESIIDHLQNPGFMFGCFDITDLIIIRQILDELISNFSIIVTWANHHSVDRVDSFYDLFRYNIERYCSTVKADDLISINHDTYVEITFKH